MVHMHLKRVQEREIRAVYGEMERNSPTARPYSSPASDQSDAAILARFLLPPRARPDLAPESEKEKGVT
jgi:hypothetical protein